MALIDDREQQSKLKDFDYKFREIEEKMEEIRLKLRSNKK